MWEEEILEHSKRPWLMRLKLKHFIIGLLLLIQIITFCCTYNCIISVIVQRHTHQSDIKYICMNNIVTLETYDVTHMELYHMQLTQTVLCNHLR